MTACGIGTSTETVVRRGFTVAADGSYAACLADGGNGCWYPERWTVGGPEPYTVPLPGHQPEEPDAQLLPLPDGRVLIRRRVAERYDLALLYPAGPGTGELLVGSLCGEEVRLLPPAGDGRAYALSYAAGVTAVWRMDGGPGATRLAEVPGRCTGGVWLDRAGSLLALDRAAEGRVKSVAVDLGSGAVSPLLQITEDSDDRLLLADPDSGLLLVRSNAPGTHRLGWGVLGSCRPVRFPDCLCPSAPGAGPVPIAVRPGESLMPESCAVAWRDGDGLALWRPADGRLEPLAVPEGWLRGSAWWTPDGVLRLPYANAAAPYGVAELLPAEPVPPHETLVPDIAPEEDAPPPCVLLPPASAVRLERLPGTHHAARGYGPAGEAEQAEAAADEGGEYATGTAVRDGNRSPAGRVLPLQQAPLTPAR